MPVKAPHYHLMGGRIRLAGPATVRQTLLLDSQPGQALLRDPQPGQAPPYNARAHATPLSGQPEEAR